MRLVGECLSRVWFFGASSFVCCAPLFIQSLSKFLFQFCHLWVFFHIAASLFFLFFRLFFKLLVGLV